MIEAKTGLVIRYSYLWAREHDRGEESGRKDRPVCVQIIVLRRSGKEAVLLFPITSHEPHASTQALLLPETEARRAGLRSPSWIIVDEWNEEEDLQNSVSVADPKPLGSFTRTFVQQIREAAIKAIRTRSYRSIRR
ncbi:hypothetical protein [Taklimakanibacter deserti]|uniref:hypothetical protein n=1 Tax=Taklimakanibacter deserti TaxID=2267839 RepID=UPI000E655CA8